jgi:asparagine synthase (glutamine-hydrolysing)
VASSIADSRFLSANQRRKLQHSFLGRGESIESLYLDNFYSAFPQAEQAGLFSDAGRAAGAYDSFLGYWDESDGHSPLERMLYADQKTYLVELLMKQDQMSMATSIESRVPFLDHQFVEFAAAVPDAMKVRRGTGKYILKKAVEDLLPGDIVHRKKMGFPTPLRQWLRRPEAERLLAMLTSTDGLVASLVDPRALGELLDRHRRGTEDATDRIWRLLNLQIWGELFLAGRHELRWEGLMAPAPAKR